MGHAQAMALAEVESQRLLEVVGRLKADDWSRPTDCTGWDVKALLSHVLGAIEANARFLEFVRQFRTATKAAKRNGTLMIDEMTALQVCEHAPLSVGQLSDRLKGTTKKAVRGRRRMPPLLRSMPIKPGAPLEGSIKMGYLVGTIMNRDYWMHRVDLTRAVGAENVLTPEHDGLIVADVVSSWALSHGQPFHLVLSGPAGGTFSQGADGEDIQLDAVEFCRALSGRAAGAGLLSHGVLF
jgi:uncharacterized protein (TIGR03083 family)